MAPADSFGEHGEGAPPPPLVLGHRGAPREAPENTLSSLRLALDLGLDGVEYDVHACATGEPVLLHDDTLERTTDHEGAIAELTLPELAGIDAGGWFSKRFRGEPLPLLQEALVLGGRELGDDALHMIELKDPRLVDEVARELAELPRPLPVRIASFHREVCLEARDHGLPTMLLGVVANEDDRRFVRDERIAAYGTGPGGWREPSAFKGWPFGATEAEPNLAAEDWPCERWSWSVDEPADLLEACRAPFYGLNTNEPRRALAARALVKLAPDDGMGWPLEVPPLVVDEPGSGRLDPSERGRHGEWSGDWRVLAHVRNPLGRPVDVAADLFVRGGAFEVDGLPARLRVDAYSISGLPFTLRGGSWSPGEDPRLVTRFTWGPGPGGSPVTLVLDATLHRVRVLRLPRTMLRLPMLVESPGERPASVSVRRRRGELIASIEDDGGIEDARAVVRLGPHVRRGARGVRVRLPDDFDSGIPWGTPFCVGFEGRVGREPVLRRWSGGLPEGIFAGAPGRLLPGGREPGTS